MPHQTNKNTEIMRASFELRKHWSDRLRKLQSINRQNEMFNIGSNHSDIRFKLTQLAIKFKL